MVKLKYLQDKDRILKLKFNTWTIRSSKTFTKLSIYCIFCLFSYQFAQAQQDFRCAVRLTFDSDRKGSVANYVLSLQLKNTKGRNVNGASILYKDGQGQVLGNTFLECLNDPEGIKPGSYGDCKVVLQRVDGEFIDTFGRDKWTEIVNTQLSYLSEIQYCDLLGFSY